ncbi:MAG: 4Fe-4S cluster-binding domain-containing protein [Puniceicoccaceae bacterium]
MKASEQSSGTVFDIQRASLQDGPGIRTTVFLKGCPLRCKWCHNPESQRAEVETGSNGKVYGYTASVDKVMEAVEKDRAYFESSGGGLTLSGGEPTFQFEFCLELLKEAREREIHTALETCGQIARDRLISLIPLVDVFLFDYKATGCGEYQRLTRASGELIRENLEFLLQRGAKVIVRCPLIPQVNDTDQHLAAIRAFQQDPRIQSVELLPYHNIGQSKARDLGHAMDDFITPSATEKERWERLTGAILH